MRAADVVFRVRPNVAVPLDVPHRHSRPPGAFGLAPGPPRVTVMARALLRDIVSEKVRGAPSAGGPPPRPPASLETEVAGQTALLRPMVEVVAHKVRVAVPSAHVGRPIAGPARPPDPVVDATGAGRLAATSRRPTVWGLTRLLLDLVF